MDVFPYQFSVSRQPNSEFHSNSMYVSILVYLYQRVPFTLPSEKRTQGLGIIVFHVLYLKQCQVALIWSCDMFFIVIQYVSFILLLMGGVGVAYTQPGLAHTTLIGATFVLEGVHGGSTPLFFYGSSYNTTK